MPVTLLRQGLQVGRNQGLRSLAHAAATKGVYDTRLFTLEATLKHLRHTVRYGRAAPDPYTILWVSPEEIHYWRINHDRYHLPDFNCSYPNPDGFYIDVWKDAGRIIGGNWDDHTRLPQFEMLPKFNGAKQHFEDGISWEETDLFRFLEAVIDEHGSIDGCRTQAALRERYQAIDDVYESIRAYGYHRQTELHTNPTPRTARDEVGVSIGRDGRLFFQGGGWHRLSIAKLLDIAQIPVRVVVRHQQWQELRAEIASSDRHTELSKRACQVLPHPDLTDVVQVSGLDPAVNMNHTG